MFTTYIRLGIWNLVFVCFIFFSCSGRKAKLTPVSYSQFEMFVNQTGYVTDAEKYGWSIVQTDVDHYRTVKNANWRMPDGVNRPNSKELPVTQVSYNDAFAYCKWAKKRLPNYKEYWELVKNDTRVIVSDNKFSISNVNEVNILGNVWDITETEDGNSVRLAGGSLFCSEHTCNGTVKGRELIVDKETGNINVGFCVVDL
jgi:hypothetical protein